LYDIDHTYIADVNQPQQKSNEQTAAVSTEDTEGEGGNDGTSLVGDRFSDSTEGMAVLELPSDTSNQRLTDVEEGLEGASSDREMKRKAARKQKRTAFRQSVNAAKATLIYSNNFDPDQTPTQKRKASTANHDE
jgi:hypothetical protein